MPDALGLRIFHEPPEPQKLRIDFIFVHALSGGPRKTCSPSYIWPKKWLSEHPEFGFVRIRSFGYTADLEKGTVDILHFARSLLDNIKDNLIGGSKVGIDGYLDLQS